MTLQQETAPWLRNHNASTIYGRDISLLVCQVKEISLKFILVFLFIYFFSSGGLKILKTCQRYTPQISFQLI